ncbi:MAG: response regulator [Puniceicoccaceae bacterium]
MRFLVVDDEPLLRKMLTEYLSFYCSDIDIAADGREAIEEYTNALLNGKPYTLICLDVDMPILDGNTALKRIRKTEQEMGLEDDEKTKILMTTALSEREAVLEILKNGPDGYLLKPFKKERLTEELKKLGLIRE